MKLKALCTGLILLQLNAWAQHSTNLLRQIIKADSFDIKYAKVLANPAKYHLQVIYTQITRDSNNVPHLKKYSLTPKTENYYYPGSLVKLPLVAMALEKLDTLNIAGLTKDTRLETDSVYYCERNQYRDTTAKNGYPSIAHYIKKMLLVSDNYSYNRIYEFLTPAYINKRFTELGYKNVTVCHRFGWGCDTNSNRVTPPFTFLSDDSTLVLYKQPEDSIVATMQNNARNTKLGKGFYQDGKTLPPKDFRHYNYIPFEDMNSILLSILFPKSVEATKRFNLTNEDYRFLYKYMSMLPKESDYPKYDQKNFKDDFKKYIYFGTDSIITDSNVRSFNIVGRAYGFIADCAYIADVQNHVEYCLSVLMYANEKNVLNTGNYQYDSLALPFMSDLGHVIYNYEKKRKKKYPPDLSEFHFSYP